MMCLPKSTLKKNARKGGTKNATDVCTRPFFDTPRDRERTPSVISRTYSIKSTAIKKRDVAKSRERINEIK